MDSETARVRINLPKELVESIDLLVGKRNRSAFIAQAVASLLDRERLGRALEATAGILTDDAYPAWNTPDKISAWVRASRAGDLAATERKLSGLIGSSRRLSHRAPFGLDDPE